MNKGTPYRGRPQRWRLLAVLVFSRRLVPPLRTFARAACPALIVLLLTSPSLALTADQIVLVANRAVPQSEQLARFYAQQRQIPDGRLLLLDLPTAETMPAEQFDQRVIMPVRRFLEEQQLRPKVRCIVTFYGVPLRLDARKNTPLEDQELKAIRGRAATAIADAAKVVRSLEEAVAAKDASGLFKPAAQEELPLLPGKAGAAMERMNALLPTLDIEARLALLQTARLAIEKLGGDAAVAQLPEMFDAVAPAATQPATRPSRAQLQARLQQAAQEIALLRQKRFDAEARGRLRQLVSEHFGLLDMAQTLTAQANYLQASPIKALDSELALLWYDDYPHQIHLPNPLHLAHRRAGETRPPVVMVSRLDAPEPGLVRDIILSSIVAERNGLSGKFAIDSRGMHPDKVENKDIAYARTDESLRQLADLVSSRAKISLLHDDAPEPFKPSAARDVALYVGWYKVRSYTPSFRFVTGAVAYHIASYEMISLRNSQEKGWCRGLLLDGVAATIGAVDEPYLFSFPDAQDFFALLMSGQFTLAETYWLTLPVVNWKMVLIGDPLYTPFAKAPALKAEDLPVRLWEAARSAR